MSLTPQQVQKLVVALAGIMPGLPWVGVLLGFWLMGLELVDQGVAYGLATSLAFVWISKKFDLASKKIHIILPGVTLVVQIGALMAAGQIAFEAADTWAWMLEVAKFHDTTGAWYWVLVLGSLTSAYGAIAKLHHQFEARKEERGSRTPVRHKAVHSKTSTTAKATTKTTRKAGKRKNDDDQ